MLIYREQLQRLLTIISIHETHHITYFISHMVFCANAGEDGSLAFVTVDNRSLCLLTCYCTLTVQLTMLLSRAH